LARSQLIPSPNHPLQDYVYLRNRDNWRGAGVTLYFVLQIPFSYVLPVPIGGHTLRMRNLASYSPNLTSKLKALAFKRINFNKS
jgi:hypothetical protein